MAVSGGSDVVDPTQQRQALADLQEFSRSQNPGVWPHLDKAEIIREMRSHLRDPFTVNQGQQPFCGPASILFELIRKDPERYVALGRSLFETGGFQGHSRRIQTSTALRQASQGNLRMGPADWMILATLRESENLIFPVEPNAPEIIRNLAGMTKSWEMKGWVREILGYGQVDYKHTYVLRDLSALRRAQQVLDQGGVAFGLITASTLLTAKPAKLAVPEHWIAIVGNIAIQKGTFGRHDSGHVRFDCFTWAQRMTVDADEGPFEDAFWGVVLGWNSLSSQGTD